MSCYSCGSEFSFFKKEVGCNVCGFAFCSRCCKKREIPSEPAKSKKENICNKCCDKLSSKQIKTTKASPPLAHKKRMASLKQSFSVDSGSSEKDREIADRLQKLKRDRITDVPSDEDIAARLAKLKGIEPSKYTAPPIEVYRRPDMRTVVEQAGDLMKQMALEAELDSRLVKPEDEIAARLARLRDEDPDKLKQTDKQSSPEIDISKFHPGQKPEEMDIDQVNLQLHKEHVSIADTASKDIHSLINDPEYQKLMMEIEKEKGKGGENNEEDEEAEANKLVEKFLANVDVEELDSLNEDTEESTSKSEKDTTEEFPWCVICSEDAKIRCFDCDSDIYCLRCFKECHDSLDIKDHKTCPYLPDKKM